MSYAFSDIISISIVGTMIVELNMQLQLKPVWYQLATTQEFIYIILPLPL